MHFVKIFAAICVGLCGIFAIMIITEKPVGVTESPHVNIAPVVPAAINVAATTELVDVTPKFTAQAAPLNVSGAMQLAKAQRFSEALRILDQMSAVEHSSFDYRFAKARILTWSGYFDQAGQMYSGLLVDFPGNPDVVVGYGYMNLFSGNLDAAEASFANVVQQFPEYDDARNGLSRTIQARELDKN